MKSGVLLPLLLIILAAIIFVYLQTSRKNVIDDEDVQDRASYFNNMFKEVCLKNAERLQGAKNAMQECLMSLVNVTVLQQEIEVAKPTGDLDVVFKKYCKKSPLLRQCVSNFTSAILPCLDEAERENKYNIIQNITDNLVQFICFKGGDRLALFILEGGVECISDRQEDIQNCVNRSLSKNYPNAVPSVDNLLNLFAGVEKCKEIRALQTCVVNKLMSCKEPTPYNLLDLMIDSAFKATPCGKLAQ